MAFARISVGTIVFFILGIRLALAGPCDFISYGDILDYKPGKYSEFIFNKHYLNKLYLLERTTQLQLLTICPYDSSIYQEHLDQVKKNQAIFFSKDIASQVANYYLKNTGWDDYLKFKFRLDLIDTTPAIVNKNKQNSNREYKPDTLLDRFFPDKFRYYRYLFYGMGGLLPEDNFDGRIWLGESTRIGVGYQTHYLEAIYNVRSQNPGIAFKEYLFINDKQAGVVGINYQINAKDFKLKNNYFEIYYSIIF